MAQDLQLELFSRFSEEQQNRAEQQIFNLQKIVDYEIREYTIELLIQKYKENEIFIPKYQRGYVWDKQRASKFIESLILGLPIPYMFLADNDGRSEIVDGSQRIRTLDYFLANDFKLQKLEKLTELEGFRFQDLPLSRQRRLKKRTIRLIELTDKADWDTRKDVFQRINTTPVLLSAMEIRRGYFEGTFNSFIEQCSNNQKFAILCPISKERTDRSERQELVLRFFAYTEKYTSFVHRVDDFLDEYMKEKQNKFDADSMAEMFEDMLDFVDMYFPYGFRKTINHNSTPRVRFEAIAVGVSLALQENPKLKPAIPVIEWLNSKEFEDITTTDAANNRNKLIGRIEFVKNKLLSKR
ncbi:DUF262 domain-containing protein [Runella aurantiaca]|uniref:DUF262 domain-containing protein n=1 Tax=Runella aurantiaca TaxID=2282308 RepID=A0A369IBN3_9BACT|nr:DUF262 domain-containing protein [Runella aurantiaca]RDB07169.1 DUF262 domain-containing protein [Runella aurantiaca]